MRHLQSHRLKGRVALHELLLGTDEINALIQNKAKTDEMVNAAIRRRHDHARAGWSPEGLLGHTTFKEVKAVAIK